MHTGRAGHRFRPLCKRRQIASQETISIATIPGLIYNTGPQESPPPQQRSMASSTDGCSACLARFHQQRVVEMISYWNAIGTHIYGNGGLPCHRTRARTASFSETRAADFITMAL